MASILRQRVPNDSCGNLLAAHSQVMIICPIGTLDKPPATWHDLLVIITHESFVIPSSFGAHQPLHSRCSTLPFGQNLTLCARPLLPAQLRHNPRPPSVRRMHGHPHFPAVYTSPPCHRPPFPTQVRYDKYRVGSRLGQPAELIKRYGFR